MPVIDAGGRIFIGLSTDTKPSVEDGSIFIEYTISSTDHRTYIRRAGSWEEATGSITDHEAAADPHAGYVLNAELVFVGDFAEKSADQTVNNSATVEDDTHLLVDVVNPGKYFFHISLKIATNATAGFRLSLSNFSGTSNGMYAAYLSGNLVSGGFATNLSGVLNLGANDIDSLEITGYLIPSVASGELALEWAQSVATVVDTKVLQFSSFTVIKMG